MTRSAFPQSWLCGAALCHRREWPRSNVRHLEPTPAQTVDVVAPRPHRHRDRVLGRSTTLLARVSTAGIGRKPAPLYLDRPIEVGEADLKPRHAGWVDM